MKLVEYIKNRTSGHLQASISSYVMMMFGIIIVCYLMGYTNLWNYWGAVNSMGGAAGATLPGAESSSLLSNPYLMHEIILTAIVSFTIAGALIKYTGGSQVLAYIVPLVFLFIFVNLFMFPVWAVQEEMAVLSIGTIAFGGILTAFLNLMLVLAVIEFIRTGTT